MRVPFVFILLLPLVSTAFAQEGIPLDPVFKDSRKVSRQQQKIQSQMADEEVGVTEVDEGFGSYGTAQADHDIKRLKDSGAIVFLVKTNSRSINAYRRAGKNQLADRLVAENNAWYEILLGSIDTHFSFCPIYFLPTDSMDAFRSGKRSGIFLNSRLEVAPEISMSQTLFYYLERGPVRAWADDGSLAEAQSISDALVFRNAEREQMRGPFPYYVRLYINDKQHPHKGKALNNRLFRYYEIAMMR